MNKSLSTILCLFIMLSICSCSVNDLEEINEEKVEENYTEIVVNTNPTILDSLDYSLGDNLPTLSFNDKVIEHELSDDDKNNELVASYDVISKDLMINILRYKRNNHTIQEALDAQIEVYYPGQGLIGYVFDNWHDEYKCNYGYYMAYDTVTYGCPYYVQTYIFVDGDEFVEADYWYECSKIKIDNNISFDIPKSLLFKTDIQDALDGEISRYDSNPLSGVPSVSFYKTENIKDDYDVIIKSYQDKYGDIKVDENKYLCLEYSDTVNANIKYYDYLTIKDDFLYSIRFSNDINNGLFNAVGIQSILSSINIK